MKWVQGERAVLVGSNKITSKVRDQIIADEIGHIIISIWGHLINLIQEDLPIIISNVVMQHFNGVNFKLVTTILLIVGF